MPTGMYVRRTLRGTRANTTRDQGRGGWYRCTICDNPEIFEYVAESYKTANLSDVMRRTNLKYGLDLTYAQYNHHIKKHHQRNDQNMPPVYNNPSPNANNVFIPTRQQSAKMYDLLESSFDNVTQEYIDEVTDDFISKETGIPVGYIVAVREREFAPPPVPDNLAPALSELRTELANAATAVTTLRVDMLRKVHETVLAAKDDILEQATKYVDEIVGDMQESLASLSVRINALEEDARQKKAA